MNSPKKNLQNRIWRETHRKEQIIASRAYRLANADKIEARKRLITGRTNRETLDGAKNYDNKWTEGDCFWLRCNMALTLKAQALHLGRTFFSVKEKRRSLGITTHAHKRLDVSLVVNGVRPLDYQI